MWDKVKGISRSVLFTEDGPEDKAKVAPQPNQPAFQHGGGQPAAASNWRPTPTLNQEMVTIIRDQTFKRASALTALVQASDSLKDIIPDPIIRLKAAYKTSGGGRKPQEIADAVAIHLNDINGEEQRFNQALARKSDEQIGGLKRGADEEERNLKAKTEEIEALRRRIGELESTLHEQANRVGQLRAEAESKEAEFNNSAAEFKVAADHVRAELNEHRTAILSTLS